MRRLLRLPVAVLVAAAAACATQSQPAKLPAVGALSRPTLPAWIASVSPAGTKVESLAQVRVIFAKPVARLASLEGDGPRDVLDHVRMEPALKGRFTLLTPRMIGFVAGQALPIGTRVRVTLAAGLRDLDGDTLASDLAWTFQTADLAFDGLPQVTPADGQWPPPVGLQPTIAVRANAAVAADTLAERATFSSGGDRVPLRAVLEAQPTPFPGGGAAQAFDPSLRDWTYDLTPQRPLARGKTYTLEIAPGVEPAYGNVATARAFSGAVRTYGALAVVATPTPDPANANAGRFAGGDPAIAFDNPLDPASLRGAVTVSPAPARLDTLVQLSDDATSFAIDPYALDPNAHYAVTLAGSIKDVFGQTLGRTQTLSIRTGNFAPGAWAPTGTNVIPAGAPVALNFYATNLPQNRYRVAYARASPQQLLASSDPLAVLPPPSAWPVQTLAGARPNVQSVVRVALQSQLGGPFGVLAYGFGTALDAGNTPSLTGLAQLTNLGVFAQFFPARGDVLVQHLSDGAPVAGVRVGVYRNVAASSPNASPVECAATVTDRNGEAAFAGVDVERCYAGSDANNPPILGIVASEGADIATLTIYGASDVYRFSVVPGWSSGAPLSRGTIFTDRQLYQPGERGSITGVAYYVRGSTVVADRDAVYRVTLSDPNNAVTSLGSVRTDAYGIFTLPIGFGPQQALGYYTLNAKGSSGNEIVGSLRVAQFKPPNFSLSLAVSATAAPAGATVRATAGAAYLFGAPLQGGNVHAYVTRQSATVAPPGWDEYWFGRQWFWPENTPSFDTDVLQRDLPLDSGGKTALDVPVPADLPFPMTYTVDMDATDVSHLSVADSKSFLALPAGVAIGLKSDVVGSAGAALPVRAIVTDAAGHPVAGRAIIVALQKMTYTSATQLVEGGQSAQQAVKYDTVSTADATSGQTAVTVNVTPPDAGPYRVRANFADAKSDAGATDIAVFAFGAGQADWGQSDPNAVAIELDKKSYAIGDTATALVASPFATADVYFSVVRGSTLYRTVLRGVHAAGRVGFKITAEMLPNAAVQAVVVRRGGTAGDRGGSSQTLARIGMTPFDVDVAQRYLALHVAAQRATLPPAARQRVQFSLASKNGTPAAGEIVAMVVNDAILQLSGYRLPDLVATVFAPQPISTILADNRENVVLKTQTPPLEKGFGYGGGYLAGAAGTRVRNNFLPTAYYGVVKTDAAGRAAIEFTTPDDLTTWRVMAVAVGDDDAHFATADSTFVTTQPLILNPLLPQFARTGDTFDAGVSLANQTGAGGALDLVMTLSGALTFASGNPHRQTTSPQAATGMQAFRFPVVAGAPGRAGLEATAALGAHRDGVSVPFSVSDAAVTESTIESGAATPRAPASVPLALDRGGSVTLTMANSIVAQFAVPAKRMFEREALPLADEIAARLISASALAQLQGPYRLKLGFDPAAQARAEAVQLLSFGRGDGGFDETAGARDADPFVSAYALDALTFARAHGVTVDAGSLARTRAFVSAVLANPGRFRWCSADAVCKARLRFEALWALASAGDRRTDFLSDIVAQSDGFDGATHIRLARYLLRTPGWQARGAAMADRLTQTLYVTGRYATANLSTRWGWLGSTADAQAQMLQLLLERHAPVEQVDGAVRALIAQQCRCGWPTGSDTASALMALSAYAGQERLGAAGVTVVSGTATVASAQFGSTAQSQSWTLPASALHGTLAIRATGGTVHYVVRYTYPVAKDAPGALAAFRVVRSVAAPGPGATPLATMDLAQVKPVALAAGQVFDIGVRVIVDHPVDRLVIDDPLPAGLEAVDTTFRTTLAAVLPQSDSWQIDAQQIYRDRVVAFAQHLDPGVYDLHYLARSVTPGTFAWPGARAYLTDAPEQFGRSAATTLTISP